MKRIVGIALLLILGMTIECRGAADWVTVKIGVAGPKSQNPQLRNVPYAKKALELFKQDFSGKLGRKLRVELGEVALKLDFVYREYDSVSDAVAVAHEFAQDDSIVGVIGFPTSAKASQVGKIFDENKLDLITPTATNPKVTRGHDRVFSMIYTDDFQGAVIAAFIRKVQGWKNVVLIYEDNPEKDNVYERGLAKSFQAAAEDYGINISTILQLPVDIDVKRLFAYSEKLSKRDRIDAVVLFATTAEAPQVVLKIRQADALMPIVVPDGLSGRTFIQEVRTIHEALHLYQPRVLVANRLFYELAPLKAGEFRQLYKNKYNGDEARIYEVFAYDAALLFTWATMKAIAEKKLRSLSPKNLRLIVHENLSKLDCRRRALPGISGDLYFGPEGAMSRNVLFAWISDVRTLHLGQSKETEATTPMLRPAYTQFKDVSINNCDGRSKSLTGSISKPPGKITQRVEGNARPDTNHLVIHGQNMKKIYVVRTGIDFYRINDINLSAQRFDIETFVWFRWKGPLKILPAGKNINPMDILQFWNGIHGLEDKTDLLIARNKSDNNVRTIAFKVKGTYVQHYALENYPFDSQDLSLYLSLANKNTDEVWLVVDNRTVQSTKEIVQRYNEKNFKIFPGEYSPTKSKHIAGTTALPSSLGDPHQKRSGGSANDFSVYEASIEVKRDMFPYFLTLFLPLGILTAVSLGSFWIPLREFSVRITIVLTTLLSVLVFHLSRADSLPNVGYLTVADKFFIAAYIGMSINIGLAIFYEWLRTSNREDLAGELNGILRYILVSITIIFIAVVGSPAVERLVGEQRYWRVMISLLILWAGIEIIVRSETVRSCLVTVFQTLTFRKAKQSR